MKKRIDPFANEAGYNLFEAVQDQFDAWLKYTPHIVRGESLDEAPCRGAHQSQLHEKVWPWLHPLLIKLEAKRLVRLAARIEKAYRAVENLAEECDAYCKSADFDYDLWEHGDNPDAEAEAVNLSVEQLMKAAHDHGKAMSLDPFADTAWAKEIAASIAKSISLPNSRKRAAKDAEESALAAYWLARQLKGNGVSATDADGYLGEFLFAGPCSGEPSSNVVKEALKRAYGLKKTQRGIPPFMTVESNDICGQFFTVLFESAEAVKKR